MIGDEAPCSADVDLRGKWGLKGEPALEVTANPGFGTAAKVREQVDPFVAGPATRAGEVKQRCRTVL